MSDFSWGFMAGLVVLPTVMVGLAMWVYVMAKLGETDPSEPLFQEEERPAPLPMKDIRGRTMWDREDPYVPKPKNKDL